MTLEIAMVLAVLAASMLLFATGWVRVDLVGLLVLVTLALTGLLSPADAISGFGDPAVVTVWAVFVLSGGLTRTGVAGMLGRAVLRFAGDSERRLIVVIMLTAAILSAFMNNVGVAALLLPVVMDIARRTGRAPSKLLLPLAFSALLGGTMTLVGTPPNILVTAALGESGLEPFRFFDFTPVGSAVVVAGIAYMALVGRRLLPDRHVSREVATSESLDDAYSLRAGLFVVDIPTGSPLEGMTLAESRVGAALGLNVMGIRRQGRVELAPDPSTRFEGGDRVLVEGPSSAADELGVPNYLALSDDTPTVAALAGEDASLAEATVRPESKLVGRTLREIDFRNRFEGVLALVIRRNDSLITTRLAEAEVQADDTLVVFGRSDAIEALSTAGDFVVRAVDEPSRFALDEMLMALTVPEGSPLVGKSLGASRLGDVFNLGVLSIERGGQRILLPARDETLQASDRLIVKGRRDDLAILVGLHTLPVDTETPLDGIELESDRVGLGEVVVAPRSRVVGRTLSEIHFREKYGLNVVGVMRGGEAHRDLRSVPLAFGDALLVYGSRERLRLLGKEPDFLVLREDAQEPPLVEKAPIAGLIMLGVVVTVILGVAPIFISAVAGAVLMVLTRCLSMDEAYRSIEWQAVFLIAGMLPLGLAMEQSGAADWIAQSVVAGVGDLGPRGVVAGLYLLTALAAQLMPTAAVAILATPLAITTATDLGLSPYALVMTVALAAAASFMSPVAHPANVLIMGPGGYRYSDYVRVGLPLTVVCFLVTLFLLPLVWPLGP